MGQSGLAWSSVKARRKAEGCLVISDDHCNHTTILSLTFGIGGKANLRDKEGFVCMSSRCSSDE